MFFNKSSDQPTSLAKQALHSVEGAIESSERASSEALDSLVDGVQQVVPLLNRASDQVSALAQRGIDSVRDSSQQLRKQAQRVSENTVSYVRVEPVKAILIAAATGAALMALVSLLSHSRRRGG